MFVFDSQKTHIRFVITQRRQYDVAAALGLQRARFSEIVCGLRVVDRALAEKIALALGCELRDIAIELPKSNG